MAGTYNGGSTLDTHLKPPWEKRKKQKPVSRLKRKRVKPVSAEEKSKRSASAKKAAVTRQLNKAKRQLAASGWQRENPRKGRFSSG